MSSMQIISPDKWTHDTGYDLALCDPFNGTPLVGSRFDREPNTPTAAFTGDFTLGDGYGVMHGVRAGTMLEGGVGVLLTDPSSAESLGTVAELRQHLSQFDCVGYLGKRSVLAELENPTDGQDTLRITASGDMLPDDPYTDKLLGLIAEERMPAFSFGPEDDLPSLALTEMENVVRAGAVLEDPLDCSVELTARDMVYANTLQWYGVGAIGLKLVGVHNDFERYPSNLLLVVPGEHADIARKLQSGYGADVQAIFAQPELARNNTYHSYAIALGQGKIPGEALGR